MPRGYGAYDEAQLQRRLWRPDAGDKALWISPGNSYTTSIDIGNGLRRSQNFTAGAGYWDFSNSTAALNALRAPDGTLSAATLTSTNVGAAWMQSNGSAATTLGNPATMSVFLKKGTATYAALQIYTGGGDLCFVNMTTMAVTLAAGYSASVPEEYSDDWWRVAFTRTSEFTTNAIVTVGMSDTGTDSGVAIGKTLSYWGVMFNEGATVVPPLYRPTPDSGTVYAGSSIPSSLIEKLQAGTAWTHGKQSRLSLSHRFKNRPPLIGD